MIELNQVINGDCIEVMGALPENSADFVLTDPPFNVGLKYSEDYNDSLSGARYGEWCAIWLREINRVLKDRHYAIIWPGDMFLYEFVCAIRLSGLKYHHLIKWHKPNCQRSLTGTRLFYRTEVGFVCSHGKPDLSLIDKHVLYSDTLTYLNRTPLDGDFFHPAARPVELYMHLIRGFTKENDIVLDPFLGSGTTAIACEMLSRRWVGIEINKEYADIARGRLKQYIAQDRLDTFTNSEHLNIRVFLSEQR